MKTAEVELPIGGSLRPVMIDYRVLPGYRGAREVGSGVPLEPDVRPSIEFIRAHVRKHKELVPLSLSLISDDVLDQLEDRLLDQED